MEGFTDYVLTNKVFTYRAKQGHAVPSQPHAPRGPFSPDLFHTAQSTTDYIPQSDSGEPDLPDDWTAQRPTQYLRWFVCTDCGDHVREDGLDDHVTKCEARI